MCALFWVAVGCSKDEPKTSNSDTGSSEVESPYVGGWPFNPQKDELSDPGWDTMASQGATVPRFIGVDQYGDEVDLYDFAGQGVPIVIDIGTIYCEPELLPRTSVRTWNTWLGIPRRRTSTPLVEEDGAALPDMIANGELYGITVLFNSAARTRPRRMCHVARGLSKPPHSRAGRHNPKEVLARYPELPNAQSRP